MSTLNDKIKLYNYIMNNKNIPLSSGDSFNIQKLAKVAHFISSSDKEKLNSWELSKEEIDLLVDDFCNSNVTVNQNTPSLFLTNPICIAHLAWSNLESFEKIKVNKEVMINIKELEKLAIRNNYILSFESPLIFKDSYAVSLNSIKLDPNSCAYIDFEVFSDEEKRNIVDYLLSLDIEHLEVGDNIVDYRFLVEANKRGWLTDDILFTFMEKCPELANYLYEIGNLGVSDLKSVPLDVLAKRDDFEEILTKMLSSYKSDRTNLYLENISNFASFIKASFGSNPSIESLKKFFRRYAEEHWEKYKLYNKGNYIDLFSKITSLIIPSEDFKRTMDLTSDIRNRFKKILTPDEYREFFSAIREFYRVKTIEYYPEEASNTINKYIAICIEREKEKYIDYLYRRIFKYIVRPKKDRGLYVKEKRNKLKVADMYSCGNNYDEIMNKYFTKYNLSSAEKGFIAGYVIASNSNSSRNYYEDFLDDSVLLRKYKKAILGKKLESIVNKLNNKEISIDDYNLGHYIDYIYESEGVYYAREADDYTEYEYKEKFESDTRLYKIAHEIMEEIYFEALAKYSALQDNETLIDYNHPLDDEHFEVYCPLTFGNIISTLLSPHCVLNKKILDNHEKKADVLSKTGLAKIIFYQNKNNDILINDYLSSSLYSRVTPFDLLKSLDRNIDKIDYSNIDLYGFITSVFCGNIIDEYAYNLLGEKHIHKVVEDNKEDYYSADSIIFPSLLYLPKEESCIPFIDGMWHGYKYKSYYLPEGEYVRDCLDLGIDPTECSDKNVSYIRITDSLDNFIGMFEVNRYGNHLYINNIHTIFNKKIYTDQLVRIQTLIIKVASDIMEITKKKVGDTNPIHYIDVDMIEELIEDEDDFRIRKFHDNAHIKENKSYVPRIYNRPRSEEIVTNNFDEVKDSILRTISLNRILRGDKKEFINHDENSSYIVGDNWFIIYDEKEKTILDSRVLDYDMEALNECKDAINSLKNKKYKVLS